MNNSCTPTMADFREAYVLARTRDGLRTEGVIAAARADANRAIAAHDAELREQVAQEILDGRPPATTEPSLREYITGLRSGIVMAADIARRKAQEQ